MNRTTRIVSAVIVLVLGAFFLFGSAPAMATGSAAVSIDAAAEATKDTDFVASVNVADLAAFDAGQFDVCFDESVLRLENVTAGHVGATQIPVDSWNKIDTGKYRVIVNVPGVPGVGGSGNLAILHLHAIGSAGSSSAIDLSNGFLNDNMGAEISATWASHSVEVKEQTAKASSPMPKLLIAAPLGAVVVGGSVAYLWMRRREAQHRI